MIHTLKLLLPTRKILCVGDVMLDRFVYGQVDRISPESPVPVLQVKKDFAVLGGAGNVARNITSLGGQCNFMSVCGNDRVGSDIQNLLIEHEKIIFTLLKDHNYTSIRKTRFIAGNQQMLRVDEENIQSLSEQLQSQLLDEFIKMIPSSHIVILSDYGKGLLSHDICQAFIETAQSFKIPVLVDPKGKNYDKYCGATFLTPNLKELSDVVSTPLHYQSDIISAAQQLIEQLNLQGMLVTQGANGMTLITKENAKHLPTQAQEVFDVSGAGDTVIATFSLGLACNLDPFESSRLSNTAAGIVVGKVGTATVSFEELQQQFEHYEYVNEDHHKIVTLHEATLRINKWKERGLSVGFTNGCFDLLHLGHLYSLKQAASHCDKLIVALNSDASVKALKGDNRPIQDQLTRSQVLEALEFVDLVIIFNEATPLTLIQTLNPDVIFKGEDYKKEQVVGADWIENKGGKVVLISLKPGYSTTQTVKKMTEN